MKVVEFLEKLGARPTKVGRYDYRKGINIESENTDLIIHTDKKEERHIIFNNVEKEIPHAMFCGAMCVFTIPIRGGFAHFKMYLAEQPKYGVYFQRIIPLKYFELVDKFKQLTRVGEYDADNYEVVNKFSLYRLSLEL